MLKIGDKAPDFEGIDQNNSLVKLYDIRNKKIILFFYPKDGTPGCTMQACNLRDNYQQLQEAGYMILGVSKDNIESHTKFISKHNLPFSLISDQDNEINSQYGVWKEKSFFGKKYWGTARTTFVIEEDFTIKNIISKVKLLNHASQILND